MKKKTTVGRYLVERLQRAGIRQIFGIPGDYVLGFYDMLVDSPIEVIGTCTEAGAAFAADGYARVNGLGAICVTYCVGGLSAVNAVAGAFAEKSPLVVISGAPGLAERMKDPYLHHRVRDFSTQRQIFEKVTVCAVALEDPAEAPRQIDEAIAACLRQKRPVYIELPRDVVGLPCEAPGPLEAAPPASDPDTLAEALAEARGMLAKAKRPAILAGIEVHRFGLQESLLKLVEKTGYPVAATLLGKSVISERHPQYLGVYEGAMGRDEVRRAIEGADCLLILGAFMTDINLGVFTAKLDPSKTIYARSERIEIMRHSYEGAGLGDFMEGLAKSAARIKRKRKLPPRPKRAPFKVEMKSALTVRRFFARMDEFLQDDMIVICDVGDSLFGAADLTIHKRTEFLSPAYYTSMGFAVPAALGAQAGRRDLRPIVFVGDGAFQMTGMELSSIVRQRLNPIIFVLNNNGYTTERFINEGPYNDIHQWDYHRIDRVLRSGWGTEVFTEGALEAALGVALKNTKSFSLINVHLDKMDRSSALERLGARLAERAQSGKKRRAS